MWENIERKYFGEGRINLFKIGEPECSLSSLLILSSLSTSSMISSLMICKTFLNRPSVFFACQILSEMLKDVLQKRGGGWWPKENSKNYLQLKFISLSTWNLIEIKISFFWSRGLYNQLVSRRGSGDFRVIWHNLQHILLTHTIDI